MRVYNKRLYNTLILFFITAITLLLCLREGIGNYIERTKYIENYRSEEDNLKISLWNGVTDNSCGNYKIFINWWCKEKDNHYVLFVPGSMKEERLYWLLGGQGEILLDNKKIKNGDPYNYMSGQYDLVFTENGQEKHCILDIFYTSCIPTLFLETDSGSLTYIHESKENYESGRYLFLDQNGKPCYEASKTIVRNKYKTPPDLLRGSLSCRCLISRSRYGGLLCTSWRCCW